MQKTVILAGSVQSHDFIKASKAVQQFSNDTFSIQGMGSKDEMLKHISAAIISCTMEHLFIASASTIQEQKWR